MSQPVENVVKYGSETVAGELGAIYPNLELFANELSQLSGGLIVVTSGAVMCGRAEAASHNPANPITDEQVLAGLGSSVIVGAWKDAFYRNNRLAGQVLATDREMVDEIEGDSFVQSLLKDVAAGVIPIFNTNDKMNPAELEKRHFKGENDGPAAHIAVLVRAKRLCLMTGLNGLFDNDHKVIQRVPFDPENHARLLTMTSMRGSKGQGIHAKVSAAIFAANNGVEAHIAGALEPINLVLTGETGTVFEPIPVE